MAGGMWRPGICALVLVCSLVVFVAGIAIAGSFIRFPTVRATALERDQRGLHLDIRAAVEVRALRVRDANGRLRDGPEPELRDGRWRLPADFDPGEDARCYAVLSDRDLWWHLGRQLVRERR